MDGPYLSDNEQLASPLHNTYQVMGEIARGAFGQVFKALKTGSNTIVAVKVLDNRPTYAKQRANEISILERLASSGEEFNPVTLLEHFEHKAHTCLVFPLLEQTLADYLKKTNFAPLALNDIRPMLQQICSALMKIQSMKIIYADIKPANIMLVDPINQPFRLKIIDFGSALNLGQTPAIPILQHTTYRAPEIILGLPFNGKIDMWSLGCLAAELFLGGPLYPGATDYDQLRYMIATQGMPSTVMLQRGFKASRYFLETKSDEGQPTWRLKTVDELNETISHSNNAETRKFIISSLDHIIRMPSVNWDNEADECDYTDRKQFVDLLKHMLNYRQEQRIGPFHALNQPFIDCTHIVAFAETPYFKATLDRMKVCMRDRPPGVSPCSIVPASVQIEYS